MAFQIISSDNSITIENLDICSWDLTLAPETDNNLVYGGVVTWLQDYDFHVSPAGYYINGVFYESPEAFITLSPADDELDRFDVIFVDADEEVKVTEGVPSITASQPGLDLGLELGLGVVFVQAGTTEPVGAIEECAYVDNAEWPAFASDGSINVASGTSPCSGSVSIEGTTVTAGDYFKLVRSSAIALSLDYNNFHFSIKSKGAWGNRKLNIRWYNAGLPVGSAVVFGNNDYSFSASNTTDCQFIAIDIADFNIPISQMVDEIRFTMSGSQNIGFYIDDVCIQNNGVALPPEDNDIHNQYFGPQTPGDWWIAGNGRTDGWLTSPDILTGGAGSEKFGWGSRVTGSTGTAIGFLAQANGQEGATAIGNQSVADVGVAIGFYSRAVRSVAVGGSSLASGGTAVGLGALVNSLSGIAVGGSATANGIGSISLGYGAVSGGGYGAMAIGSSAAALHAHSAAFGVFAATTADRQVVWGADHPVWGDFGYDSMYFGRGVTSFTRGSKFWTITGSQGTDTYGDDWYLAGGKGTGDAPVGAIYLQTADKGVSGSTLQSLSTKVGLNSNTLGFYMSNTRLQMTEGLDVVATGNLTLGTGNSFTITGDTGINAITSTNWQDGAVIFLLFTGTPTVQHNIIGGVGTSPIKLAGSVDFTVTPDTVLQLEYKDGFWREVGRTQTSSIGTYTFLNGLHEELGGLVKWGGTLVENTTVAQANKVIQFTNGAGRTFSVDPVNQAYQFGDIDNIMLGSVITIDDAQRRFVFGSGSNRFLDLDGGIATYIFGDIDGSGNVSTYEINDTNQTQKISNSSFQETEGPDVVAANDLVVVGGNAFTVTGNTQINAIDTTNWQEGSTIKLHLTGTPTLKHNTAGGAGTFPLRLAGATDFTISGYTVLELQYKDSFWNEVGRTVATGGGAGLISVDNGLSLSTATNAQLGGVLLHDTLIDATSAYSLTVAGTGAGIPFKVNSGNNIATQITSLTSIAVQATAGDNFPAGHFTNSTPYVDSIIDTIHIQHEANGSPAILGIGVGISMNVSNDTGLYQANRLTSTWTNLTHATRTSQFAISGANNGTVSELFTLKGTGQVQGNKYGVGSFTSGTAAYLIATDASGNWFEYPSGGIGSGLVSADNGLTISSPNNVQLGATTVGSSSPLLHNTYINTTSSYHLEVVGGNTSITEGSLVTTNNGGATSLYVQSYGGSTAGTNAYPMRLEGYFTSTNTVEPILQIMRSTTVGADGIGGAIEFRAATAASANNSGTATITNRIVSKWVTQASTSQLDILGATASSTLMSAHSSGVVGIGISSAYTATRLSIVDNGLSTSTAMVKLTSNSTTLPASSEGLFYTAFSGANPLSSTTTSSIHGVNSRTGTGSTNYGVAGTASGGSFNRAVAGFTSSTNDQSVFGTNNSGGTGVYGETATGYGVWGSATTSGGIGGRFDVGGSSTNTVIPVIYTFRGSTGTTTNGVGSSIDNYLEASDGGGYIATQIVSKWTDVTVGTRTSQTDFIGTNSASANTIMSAYGTGVVGIGISSGYTASRLEVSDTSNLVTSGVMTSFSLASTAAASNTQTAVTIGTSGANSNASQRTKSLSVTNTHTGTTPVNVGAQFSATGGTDNYAILVPASSGFVGVGIDPVSLFHVERSANVVDTSNGNIIANHTSRLNLNGTALTTTSSRSMQSNYNVAVVTLSADQTIPLSVELGVSKDLLAFTSTTNSDLSFTQGAYIRAAAATYSEVAVVSSLNAGSTINHTAAINILPFYALDGTADAGTFTNYYALLINDQTSTYIPATSLTITNQWGIYQEGASDRNYFAASTGFGTSTPHASAQVEISSTTKGFLLPRMTKTQRDAIATPTSGLAIYQTDNTPGLRVFNGTNWMKYTEATD